MINSYFRPTRPSQAFFPTYPSAKSLEKTAKYRRYKLLLIVLARATQRCLKEYWDQLWLNERRTTESLSRLLVLCDKNAAYSLFLGLERIKQKAVQSKASGRFFKGLFTLLQRMEKYKLKQSFSRLLLHTSRCSTSMLSNYFQQREQSFCRKLHVMVKRHRKEGFNAIAAYARFVKSYSKLRVIAVIHNRFHRGIKQNVLVKLHRYVNSRNLKPQVDKQMRELKLQLQDMTVQLQNKAESIQRLEEELNQIRVEQSNFSYREVNHEKLKKGSFKSYSLKKLALYDSSKSMHNDSNDNISVADMSIGSLLGNLNKSRTGSINKYDPNSDCNCGFKTKCLKYKNLNESLKNQLQIVKEELEVAKDLNEHFTNEIRQYLSGEGNEGDYEKLKKDYKAIVDERDQLRQKVFKYQKHIASLKSEFKVKMEELYRKVRKDM